jgi:hypothetical protein
LRFGRRAEITSRDPASLPAEIKRQSCSQGAEFWASSGSLAGEKAGINAKISGVFAENLQILGLGGG